MTYIDDPEFEPVIRDAMRSRPEPGAISNLAYRAIERARAQTAMLAREQLELLWRMRRRNRWVAMAASVLIAVVVFVGVKKLSDAGLLGGTASTSATLDSNSSDSTSTSASGGAMTLGVELTVELLVVAMVLLSAGIASSRPEYGEATFS